jgi:P-type Mg2+ transporter
MRPTATTFAECRHDAEAWAAHPPSSTALASDMGTAPPSELDELAAVDSRVALRRLASSADGLDEQGASERRRRVGSNELEAAGRPWHRILGQLRSPLIGLLVVAAAIAAAVGERLNVAIILTIVAASVGLGVFNEYDSEQTLGALRKRTGRRATVLRRGTEARGVDRT